MNYFVLVTDITERNIFRAFAYSVTQDIKFKRFVAVLVLANCSLLAVPVSDIYFKGNIGIEKKYGVGWGELGIKRKR